MARRKNLVCIWDCGCGICSLFKRTVAFLDWFNVIDWRCLQDESVYEEYGDVSREMLEESMVVLTPRGGEPQTGIDGVRSLLINCPLLFVFGVLFYFPGFSHLGNALYYWVADNRDRFSQACGIEPEGTGNSAANGEEESETE